jgi:hypothetical protein
MLPLRCLLLSALLVSVSVAQTSKGRYAVVPHELTNGRIEVRLINTGSAGIDVFHAVYKCPTFEVAYDWDRLLNNEMARPIVPGSTYIPQMVKLVKECNLRESAVLYDDGSAGGDASAVSAIYAQRAGALEELAEVHDTIMKAAAGGLDEQALTKYLAGREAKIDDLNLTPASHVGHLAVLQTIERQFSLEPSHEHSGPAPASEAKPDIVTRSQAAVKAVDAWRVELDAAVKPR